MTQASLAGQPADPDPAPGRAAEAPSPRIAIVAPHASLRFGGEAALPFHFFRVLRKRGVEAWLVVHERCRDALLEAFPDDADRITFLPDLPLDRALHRIGLVLPARIRTISTDMVMSLITERRLRREARGLIRSRGVELVHQPIPVSPKYPSLMGGLGVPVVMGPMNGGMEFPPAFRGLESRKTRLLYRVGRAWSVVIHRLIGGKRRAETLLVANRRTADALPRGVRGEVIELVENGVDLDIWDDPAAAATSAAPSSPDPAGDSVPRFVFLGRLVDWKAVDLLLEALARVVARRPAQLTIVGDGVERPALERQARALGLIGGPGPDAVEFAGWQTQAECSKRLARADALVLPSLYECGGAVVLEAMAAARPVIATRWGGPADYLDPSCGILVPPDSREQFIAGLADAMTRLADDPDLRRRMGDAGRRKVLEHYCWDRKADAILAIYDHTLRRSRQPVGS